MAVQLDTVTVAKFEDLFQKPSIERFLSVLTPYEFQDFVGYVFTCAGYGVENVSTQFLPHGPGVDLQIYRGAVGGKLAGRIEVKQFAVDNPVGLNIVAHFNGVLDQAPVVPGILVTTSRFASNAVEFARHVNHQLYLIDGDHLIRYITYIRGSRIRSTAGSTGSLSAKPINPKYLFEGDKIIETAASQQRARILTVANNKGGVAKTTTALNLGLALATQQEPKQRVLVIDMDSQSSLTHSLPKAQEPESALHDESLTMADAIGAGADIGEIARGTRFPRLAIAPSSPELLRYDTGSGGQPEAELDFARRLHELAAQTDDDGKLRYDWVIIDTPPAQSSFTRMALAAADAVLVPARVETFAELGVNGVVETLRTTNALFRPDHRWQDRLAGCVITSWRANSTSRAERAAFEALLDDSGVSRLQTTIPQDDKIEQAIKETSQGRLRMVFQLGRAQSPAAQAYAELAKEIRRRAN